MSSKTIVCAACNAAVPHGRLSCPSCGELLASVAGAARPMVSAAAAAASTPTTPESAAAVSDPRPTPSVLTDVPSAEAATSQPDAAAPEPAAAASDPDGEPQWPEFPPAMRSAGTVAPPYAADAPGAYVPPVVLATPAGPPALARAWAGHAIPDEAAPDPGAGARASAAALMDGARLPEFVGWLAVAGSAMAAIGFVLPWGMSVIGASGVDYFDRWGLAGPFHPVVVVALLTILGLALVKNPIPLWVRVGLPGLGVGALLVGLIWPYLVGLPGRGPGVLVVAVGAIILIAAGIIAVAADRHAPEDRAV